jgi:hypothetical protein
MSCRRPTYLLTMALLILALLAACDEETATPVIPDQATVADGAVDGSKASDTAPTKETGATPDQSSSKLDGPQPLPDTGVTSCKTACDCPQGQACTGGTCITGTKPVYCCAKPGCPVSLPCINPSGTAGLCQGASTCKNHCDCLQGQMCQSGQCITGTKPVYCCTKSGCPKGQACYNPNGTTGKCGGAGQCSVDCDCLQGQMCAGGICVNPFIPVYCCTKLGCPKGQACSKLDGSKGTCP